MLLGREGRINTSTGETHPISNMVILLIKSCAFSKAGIISSSDNTDDISVVVTRERANPVGQLNPTAIQRLVLMAAPLFSSKAK